MKIYAVGDSFTAGSELVDEKYYNDFPGYSTAHSKSISKNPYNEWYKNKPWLHRLLGGHKSDAYQQALQEEKSLTYANQLGDILDWPTINHGLGGCSLDTIVRNLTLYLDTVSEPHIVFFQPTSGTRWCQYYENTWRDFIAGNEEQNVSQDFQRWMQLKITLEDDYSWAMRWWLNIQSAISQLQSHQHVKKFYIVESGIIRWTRNHVLENPRAYARDDLGNRLIKTIDNNVKPHLINFSFNSDEAIFCPGGHFNHIVHRRLAEDLAKILK
jgi:hypothetical protein